MEISSHIITNIALVSPCKMFNTGFYSLLAERMPVCRVILHCESLVSAEKRLSKSVDLLLFSLPCNSLDMGKCISILREIRDTFPRLKIVVIIERCIPYLIANLKSLKVNTIISQKASLKEWVLHINLVLKGVRTYSSHVVETMHRTPDFNSLKYDEFSVLSYIAQGVTLENVANLMSRGIKTIEVRRTKGMRKLGMHHYAELIAIKNILKDENFRLTMAMW